MSKELMINCKEATELAVKKSQQKLSFIDWIRLQIHLFVCKYCRRFVVQNKLIDQAVHEIDQHPRHHDLPPDFKQRVLHELEK